jgi:hypothetical protein
MSKSELDVEENKSETVGVNMAGEGAFPPTPVDLAQLKKKKIIIDLNELYSYTPKTPAAKILESILQHYSDAEIIALLTSSPP